MSDTSLGSSGKSPFAGSFRFLVESSSLHCGTEVYILAWLSAGGHPQLLDTSLWSLHLDPTPQTKQQHNKPFSCLESLRPPSALFLCFQPEKVLSCKGLIWFSWAYLENPDYPLPTILRPVTLIIPAKSLFPCNITYSQVSRIRTLTTLGIILTTTKNYPNIRDVKVRTKCAS